MLYSSITSRDALITLRGVNSTPALIEHILPSLDHLKCIGRAEIGKCRDNIPETQTRSAKTGYFSEAVGKIRHFKFYASFWHFALI